MGRFLKAGDLVFDIGANVGDKTAACRRHGARVVCVEPDARNIATLSARFADDSDVQIIAAGAGAIEGSATFYPSPASARSTFALDAMRALNDGCAFHAGSPVGLTTLDALIARFGRPHFVKIDVEGFEPAVLAGLSQSVPVLSFEFHGALRSELCACLDRLESIGMKHFNVLLYPVGDVKRHHRLDRLYFEQPVARASLDALLEALRDRPLAGDVYAFVVAPSASSESRRFSVRARSAGLSQPRFRMHDWLFRPCNAIREP